MWEGMIVHNCVLLNVPRPMKFTAFVDKLVEKNTSISSKHKDFKILLELARKRLFEQNTYILNIIQSFQERNSNQFGILSMQKMCKERLEVILSVNFGLFGENFVTSFI